MIKRENEEPAPQLSPKEMLTAYLEKWKIRKSPERYSVLEAASRQTGLFTIAQLYDYMLGVMHFHLSKATVYSALEVLTQAGIVVEHMFDTHGTRFEWALGRTTFNYMICTRCGRITPIVDPSFDRAVKLVRTPRLHVTHSKTYVYGVCAACVSKERKINRKQQAKDNDTRKS